MSNRNGTLDVIKVSNATCEDVVRSEITAFELIGSHARGDGGLEYNVADLMFSHGQC